MRSGSNKWRWQIVAFSFGSWSFPSIMSNSWLPFAPLPTTLAPSGAIHSFFSWSINEQNKWKLLKKVNKTYFETCKLHSIINICNFVFVDVNLWRKIAQLIVLSQVDCSFTVVCSFRNYTQRVHCVNEVSAEFVVSAIRVQATNVFLNIFPHFIENTKNNELQLNETRVKMNKPASYTLTTSAYSVCLLNFM